MKLVIGGLAQGKLNYVLHKEGLDDNAVWDRCLPKMAASKGRPVEAEGNPAVADRKPAGAKENVVVINHFHEWVKERLKEGRSPEEEILSFLEHCKDCIIISDEIGNGIVPLDAFEREYRERAGRLLVVLAGRAEEVERVICGIGQKIK